MMPTDWQRAFLNSGQVITNNDYTLLALQRFMTLQEEQSAVNSARRRQRQTRDQPRRNTRQGIFPQVCRREQGGPPFQRQRMQPTPPVSPYRPYPSPQPYNNPSFQRPPIPTRQQPWQNHQRRKLPNNHNCGQGRGCNQRGDAFHTQTSPPLPPTVAEPIRPSGNPPDHLHYEDFQSQNNQYKDLQYEDNQDYYNNPPIKDHFYENNQEQQYEHDDQEYYTQDNNNDYYYEE